MKKYRVLCLLFLSMLCLSVAAANGEYNSIGEAQTYGIQGANLSQEEFLAPWRSYEEKAQQLSAYSDQAYCYTPYLVVASDAWAKVNNHKLVFLRDGEKIWQDYAGFLTFTIQLSFNDPEVPKNVSLWVEQNNHRIYAYQITLPTEGKPVTVVIPGQPARQIYLFTAYSYFMDDAIRRDSPLILVATAKDKQYRFYFDMASKR